MLLLLLLQWPLLGPKGGQGRGRTFVWALLRASNYLVPEGFIWDQTGGPSDGLLQPPFYRGHLRTVYSWVSQSPSLPSSWTPGPSPPPWDCPFPPFGGHGAASALWCPAVDAGNIMLAKEAEDRRDRSRLLGLGGLAAPTSELDVPTELEPQASPWLLGRALCHPWCRLPCHPAVWARPSPWVRVGLPSNTDHSSRHSLLSEGLDFSFWTVCIGTQWCQIKPRRGPGPCWSE